ncbi:MAG TPA: chemotaxis protein CheB [Stellaceae bacterium]|jgi:two-component system CheB/CheR fusion protein|nr:chemotaxis protein CheB [Stellaceae bacterium]
MNMSRLIVGIGASAGGLDAFTTFFENMPPDSGMAFVLVQHLDPHHKSMLAEIIARSTKMVVTEATDGTNLAANHVFVIPPDATLTVACGRLRVTKPAPPRDRRRPIDSFFIALAEDQGEKAVCIILSGFGSDGTLGLSAVKERGGLTLTQAEFDHSAMSGMPSSATATGLVDHVLPVEEMPSALISYQRHLGLVEERKDSDGTRRDAAEYLPEICTLLRDRLGHDFSGYKKNTMVRRIQRRMQVLQISDMPAYTERLRGEPDQIDLLFRELLIGVTQFFRDPAAFDTLAQKIVPKMIADRGLNDTIRVWVAGCATGEEAYSIAILLREALAGLERRPNIVIFATDLDDRAVAVARSGCYQKSLVRGLSPERLERWFIDDDGFYRAKPEIRECCIFSVHNVVKDPPFSKLDLISCRNLLIYLDAGLQDRLVPIFHYALLPGGTLFLGPSETVNRQSGLFTVVDAKHNIFTLLEGSASGLPDFPLTSGGRSGRPANPMAAKDLRRLLAQFSPAYVVVDEHRDVVQFSEHIGKYLGPAPGRATLNVLTLLRKGLRPVVRSAMQEAISGLRRAVRENILLEWDGDRRVTLIVEPISVPPRDRALFLLAFQELQRGAGDADTNSTAPEGAVGPGSGTLTDANLRAAIEQAETAVEQLRTANEEYQSANEELQSTNEELETAKEEIQSINEELQTVNTELSSKNESLLQLNSDLNNLLESTQIATLFLSEDLMIRNFTPAMTEILHIREADIGRPVTEIVSRLDYGDLERDVGEVVQRLRIVERQVAITHGATFQMRIRPYRKVNRVVDGVVITFVDMTERAASDVHRDLLMAELDHRVKNMLTIVQSLALQTMHSASTMEAFREAFESRLDGLAKTHNLLMQSDTQAATLRDLAVAELSSHAADDGSCYVIEGDDLSLDSRRALAIGMMFHELATNAAKYGALSVPTGRVTVSWTVTLPGERSLHLQWVESGGPAVVKPDRQGFGSRLIERGLAHELNAKVSLTFDRAGVRCAVNIPLTPVIERHNHE